MREVLRGGTALFHSSSSAGSARGKNCQSSTPVSTVGGTCLPTAISGGVPISNLQRGELSEKEEEKEAKSWEQYQCFVLGKERNHSRPR